ncbi:MAG: hypothetical protein V4719_14960 [Planctomycetota bacterium]
MNRLSIYILSRNFTGKDCDLRWTLFNSKTAGGLLKSVDHNTHELMSFDFRQCVSDNIWAT